MSDLPLRLDQGSLHQLMGYQLARAAIPTTKIFVANVGEPFDLRPVEFTILALVAQNPGLNPKQLATALAVTAPNITAWIDRLAERGLVERERSESDRRAQHLRTSAAGAKLAAEAQRRLLEAEQQGFAHLTQGERAILLELLNKVADGGHIGSDRRRALPK